MRTTIEITDDQRARLIELANARGEKGFSRIVREAIELYLELQARREQAAEAALALQGVVSTESADELERSIQQLRERWQ